MKVLTLSNANRTISNENIAAESFTLQQSICSEKQLRFGSCETSSIKLRIRSDESVIGEAFDVSLDTGSRLFDFGRFTIYKEKLTADRCYRDIEGYDAMYDVLNAELTEWYMGLTFPITLREFRDSFFEYIGIEQSYADLCNDDMQIEQTIEPSSLHGKDVIKAICELNGCFGRIGSDGSFMYVMLNTYSTGLFPNLDLYPADDLYPETGKNSAGVGKRYKKCTYADYSTALIDKLQLRYDDEDVGAIVGTGENAYVMQGNFLVYGKGAEELQQIAENVFSVINGIFYVPYTASIDGRPDVLPGAVIRFNTSAGEIKSYILKRVLSGIQSLTDDVSASGDEKQPEQVRTVNSEIIQLRGKTNRLVRDVGQLVNEVYDSDTGESRIEQLANKIELKVSVGDVSSQISLEEGDIEITSNRFSLDSTNCKISKDGTIIANSIDIRGGSINIETDSESADVIILRYYGRETSITPASVTTTDVIANSVRTNFLTSSTSIAVGAYSYSNQQLNFLSSSSDAYAFSFSPQVKYSSEVGGYVFSAMPSFMTLPHATKNVLASY